MTAINRLYRDSPLGQEDRSLRSRKADRKFVSANIQIESAEGQIDNAVLRDISAFGCNVRTDAEWVRLGKFVSVSLGKTRRIQAVIRWTRSGVVGLEFLRPIPFHEADIISDHLEP